jgi:hypothetical protein
MLGQPISTHPAGWTTRSHETGHWRHEPAAGEAAGADGVSDTAGRDEARSY